MRRILATTAVATFALATLVGCKKDTTSGVWDTNYGGDTVLTLKNEGDGKMSGAFSGTAHNGTLTGTMSGKTLSGRFDEGATKGTVTFTFGDDGTSFTGLYQSDDKKHAGSWDGHKRGAAVKDAAVGIGSAKLITDTPAKK